LFVNKKYKNLYSTHKNIKKHNNALLPERKPREAENPRQIKKC
jgi:hypothetical protein